MVGAHSSTAAGCRHAIVGIAALVDHFRNPSRGDWTRWPGLQAKDGRRTRTRAASGSPRRLEGRAASILGRPTQKRSLTADAKTLRCAASSGPRLRRGRSGESRKLMSCQTQSSWRVSGHLSPQGRIGEEDCGSSIARQLTFGVMGPGPRAQSRTRPGRRWGDRSRSMPQTVIIDPLRGHPAHAGDPVRCGLSDQSLLPLEYWIARLRGR